MLILAFDVISPQTKTKFPLATASQATLDLGSYCKQASKTESEI